LFQKSQPNGHVVAVEPPQVTVRQTASGRQTAAAEKTEVANKVKTVSCFNLKLWHKRLLVSGNFHNISFMNPVF